jgi:hypothetical protein
MIGHLHNSQEIVKVKIFTNKFATKGLTNYRRETVRITLGIKGRNDG